MNSRNADLFAIAPVAMLLLSVNILLFIYCGIASGNLGTVNSDVLLGLGMSVRERVWQGEWFRMIMPMFLHGGFWHIALNTIALYRYGPATEVQYGHANYGTLYLLSGVGGIAFSQIFGGHHSIGASTSLFGVMGALLALTILRVPVLKYAYRNSEVRGHTFWIVLMYLAGVCGMLGNVDNWGHLGGLVFGLIIGGFFEIWRKQRRLALPLVLTVAVLLGSVVAAARWTIFSPYYHLHMGALAGDAGDTALQQKEFDQAVVWSKPWHKERLVEFMIEQYKLKRWNAEQAADEGYIYLPRSVANAVLNERRNE